MLLTTTNNNLFDTFFSDPWFNRERLGERSERGRGQEVYLQRALLRKLSENLLCG